jgi:hypothetical protein
MALKARSVSGLRLMGISREIYMTQHIKKPAIIQVQGNKLKSIEEFIGRINTGTSDVSVARRETKNL